MKTLAPLLLSLAAVMAASCGGGDDDTSEFSSNVPATLVASGEISADAAPVLSQVVLITSAAQLAQVADGRFTVPAALAAYNFTDGDVIYIEAPGDQDPLSVVRLAQVSRGPGGEFINAETCGSVVRAAGNHRPYSIYTVAKLPNYSAYSLVNSVGDSCVAVKRASATFVAGGSVVSSNPSLPPTLIRTQAELNLLIALVPAGTIPPAFLAPDFSQANLLFVSTPSAHVGSYTRLVTYLQETDNSRTAVVEFCDEFTATSTGPVVAFGLYAVAPFSGDVRIARIVHGTTLNQGACVTTR